MNVIGSLFSGLAQSSGIAGMTDFRQIVMIFLSCVLLYLGIVKQFEPLLLVGIAFGMLLTNLPGAGLYHAELWANASNMSFSEILLSGGLLDILYLGVKLGLYPSLIFLGIGAMTDFGPIIANPSS